MDGKFVILAVELECVGGKVLMVLGPEGGLGVSGSGLSLRGNRSCTTTRPEGGKAGVQTLLCQIPETSLPAAEYLLMALDFSDS